MHMVVTTPLGQIKTIPHENTEYNVEATEKFLKQINDLNYITLITEEGDVYMAKGMIQQSIFALVK